ncbi:MAG: hypothetical protein RR476_05045 [Cetobacterium sp.]|uniref:hypothetical protein n=1 Tax=Cetobacterium sp. TaxID=2071632 RepID=UPI002FC6697A
MKKYLLAIVSMTIFISCTNSNTLIKEEDLSGPEVIEAPTQISGEKKEYYENGAIKTLTRRNEEKGVEEVTIYAIDGRVVESQVIGVTGVTTFKYKYDSNGKFVGREKY